MNRQFPRPTLDGVLSLNSSQATNTNVSIVTSSSSRASTNNNHHLHHHAAPGGGGGGRDRAVAASYVVSDSGAQLTLGGAYHVSSTGAHELNPVTGSTTRLGRGDSSSRLNGGGLHGGGGGGGGGAAGGSTSLSASNNREAGAGAGGGAGGPSSSSSLRCKHISELDMENGLLIGRGSSGRAYNVIHTPSGVRVCVKQMQIDDTRHREEVKRELDALHRAASRFVIDFYGAFFQNDLGVILLVLELMEGSMLDVMKSGVGGGGPLSSSFSSSSAAAAGSGARLLRPLPERSIRAFALQVVLGLELLHQERGIIHRDIKPANLLFHRGGSVKIADFGVSTDCAALGEVDDPSSTHPPQTKTFVGSVLYMSPERLQGQPYSYSVDVWSLGVTLYEAAVGKHPFQEEGQPAPSFWELLQRVAQQDDALHRSPLRCHGGLGSRVSDAMDSFVALCLSYLPEDRPTASELLMHPWLQSLSLEESESIVAEVHTARQTLLEQQQQQQQQGIGSAAAAAGAGGTVQAEEGPQTLLCSAMLVGNGAPPSSTGGGGGEGSGGGGGAGAAAAAGGGGGGGRRQRGDALLSEFVASFQRTI